MGKQVRVGGTIYDGSTRVAEHTHGAWYEYKTKNKVLELVPCDAIKASKYETMIDANTAPLDAGELTTLQIAQEMVDRLPYRVQRNSVMRRVEEGIKYGITKHGPYHPDVDERDLTSLVARSARNVIVYASMELARPNPRNADRLRVVAAQAIDMLAAIEEA